MALLRKFASLELSKAIRRSFSLSSMNAASPRDEAALQSMKNTELQSYEMFEKTEVKNKKTFEGAIDLFNERSDPRKRGQVEFIQAALKNMKAYGVHKDLEVYKKLIDIMPKGKYVASNRFQQAFLHYPKQQFCIVDVLEQMEEYRVVPDRELGKILNNIFGIYSQPFIRFSRMWFWLPKLQNLSPWPLPEHLPKDGLELAKLAIERITSVDRRTSVKVYQAEDIPESIDKGWIVSGQSIAQKEMVQELPKNKPLYVEGPFRVWLADVQVNYFTLRGEAIPRPPPPEGSCDDVSDLKNWVVGQFEPNDLVRIPNVHEQEDGTIISCCATATSSKDSLLSWIRHLQIDNPDLENIPILFMLSSAVGPIVPFEESKDVTR